MAVTYPARQSTHRIAAILLSACLAFALASCGKTTKTTKNAGDFSEGYAGITRVAPADRGDPVTLVGRDLGGDALSSEQWLGKIVVVNVWGSWCPPCRVEQPILSKVATELKPDGVEFLGIAIRESAVTSRAFTRAEKVPYPSIGEGEQTILAFTKTLPPIAIPTTYVLDRQGRVATRVLDRITYATLKSLINEVADEPDDG